MFKSNSGEGEGTSDPDNVSVEELHDEDYDEHWLRIIWDGEEYADAWLLARSEDTDELSDNR